MASSPSTRTRVFISYSHADKEWLERLTRHLKPLVREGYLDCWDDTHIRSGDDWRQEICAALDRAQVAVLLISADFFASDFIDKTELRSLLAAAQEKGVRVLPVILSASRFERDPSLARFQAVNSPDRPLDKMPKGEQEEVLERLAQAIESALVAEPKVKKAGDPRDLPDLAVFRDVDVPWCPEMVVLPVGGFWMGSPEDEKERDSDEGPQYRVSIGGRFAIGHYPVTVSQYSRFVEAMDCPHEGGMYVWNGSNWKKDVSKSWRDPGFKQTDQHPVVGVSWQDAQTYVQWLAKETGRPYRLPSEVEWEYACRAGTRTRYAFGDAIPEEDANCGWKRGGTTEVGAYPANPWGLYDMHGNVWEWVEDAWHDGYVGAPWDGERSECSRYRVLRGGSWHSIPKDCRSANRGRDRPDSRYSNFGFRVARTLN